LLCLGLPATPTLAPYPEQAAAAEAREAAEREGREGLEAELAVARLQCEQLQGHMEHLTLTLP